MPRIDHGRILPPDTTIASIPSETELSEGQERQIALDQQAYKEKIAREEDVYRFRKKGYRALFWLIVAWLALTAALLIASGLQCLVIHDNVLIALLTTSTATVLGIFAIAAKWLFPKDD